MKSFIFFIITAINLLITPVLASENTLFSVSDTADSNANYFDYSSSFTDIIKCRGIHLKETPVFYLDSDITQIQLEAHPMPANTTNRAMTYSSSDPSIISIDENGLMSAHNKGGKVQITVTCDGVSEPFDIEVIRAASGVELSRKDMLFYIDQYMSAPLEAHVLPADATNKNVKWQSSDTAVAYVDENGVVSPVGTGYATVTATTEDGGFKASCEIYVKVYNIPVRACYIKNAPDCMGIGDEYKLQSYVYPENSINSTVIYKSSDESVATVSTDGTIKAHAEGMALITASTKNGCEDSFNLTVYPTDTEFVQTVISPNLEERLSLVSMPIFPSSSKYSLDEAITKQMSASPTVFTTNAAKATKADVQKYIDPSKLNSGYAKYQFLDLRRTNGISEDRLNKYLSDKGILRGKADVFIEAAKANGISEVYLAVHSALESGNGTSTLAKGVDFKGKKVYNLFGIGAFDSDPVGGGAEYAYNQGWFDIDSAIYGAAQWISENYIYAGQNTLYKMRWNPKKPGTHQYATDVAWAQKQASVLKSLVEGLTSSDVLFDVTTYEGQDDISIKYE